MKRDRLRTPPPAHRMRQVVKEEIIVARNKERAMRRVFKGIYAFKVRKILFEARRLDG